MSASTAETAKKATPAKSTKGKKRKAAEESDQELSQTQGAKEVKDTPKKKAKTPLEPARLQAINGAKSISSASHYFASIGDKKKSEELWETFLQQVRKHNLKVTVLYE